MGLVKARCIARGVTATYLLGVAGIWIAVAVVGPVSLTFIIPPQQVSEVTAPASLVGLIVPIGWAADVLLERVPHLIATTPRRLRGERAVVVTCSLVLALGGGLATGGVTGQDLGPLLANAMLLLGIYLGCITWWNRIAATGFALLYVMMCAAPGLVPFDHNPLFSPQMSLSVSVVAAALVAASALAYVVRGSHRHAGLRGGPVRWCRERDSNPHALSDSGF